MKDEEEFNFIDEDGQEYADYVFDQFGYSDYSGETRAAVLLTLKELWDAEGKKDFCYCIRYDKEADAQGYEWAFQEFLLGILNHFGLTEYGTSPRGSWLTEKGIKLLRPLFEGK